MPDYFQVPDDNKEWLRDFSKELKKYRAADSVVEALLMSNGLLEKYGVLVRLYVDKNFSKQSYAIREQNGLQYRHKLETAVSGLMAAAEIFKGRAQSHKAAFLALLVDELNRELVPRQMLTQIAFDIDPESSSVKRAYTNKRRGRDRDHSILCRLYCVLLSADFKNVTFTNLANLLNAASDTIGTADAFEPNGLRQDLANFHRNNPEFALINHQTQTK